MKIEKGVPFTERRKEHTQVIWDAMHRCEVGDSFFVETGEDMKARTLSVLVLRYQRQMDRRFAVRTQEDGVRVWRVG